MFSGRLQRLYFFRLQVGFRSSPCVSYSGTRLQGLQGGTLLANERRQASCVRLLKAPLTSCTSIPLVEAGQDQRQPVGSRFPLREATVKGRKGRMSCAQIMPPAPCRQPRKCLWATRSPCTGDQARAFWFTSLCIRHTSFIHLIRTNSNAFLFIAE